jgi:DNA-binding CsgD family transcriptional regulator
VRDYLTEHERRVLDELCVDGESNQVLGARLYVSAFTIKYHLQNIALVTGVHGRTALALWWIRTGRWAYYAREALAHVADEGQDQNDDQDDDEDAVEAHGRALPAGVTVDPSGTFVG